MHTKLQHRKESGFTIIEVLIVLAIAGLILLVVFLAVPALQRNSRNTTIKNDAQNVLGGVSEYRGAKDGANPASIDVATPGVVKYRDASAEITSIKIQGSTKVTAITAVPSSPPAVSELQVYLGQKCASDTTVSANTRSVAVFYSIETSGNAVQKCVDS